MRILFLKKYLRPLLLFIGGIVLGWIFFHNPASSNDKEHVHTESKKEWWTCSMHPQIKSDHPGKCPLCAMDLVPLVSAVEVSDSSEIHLSDEALQASHVMTSLVSKKNPVKQLRLFGKVQIDERNLKSLVAHFNGRIERLMVNYTGEKVRKGQLLAVVYSPDLITAQQELLEAAKIKSAQPEILDAVRRKFYQWSVGDQQISQILKKGVVKTNFEFYATTSGVVTGRRVQVGDYVRQGDVLFDLAGLSAVWVLLDAYESDLPFVKVGDPVRFTTESIPGRVFTSRIQFIDPVFDATSRVVRLRLSVDNANGLLKPEMFVTASLNGHLEGTDDKLLIPASAVLWTGKRSVVYLKKSVNAFRMQEVELGPAMNNSYIVLKGLAEGDEIVTNGAFSIDAAAELEGKPSMMNH